MTAATYRPRIGRWGPLCAFLFGLGLAGLTLDGLGMVYQVAAVLVLVLAGIITLAASTMWVRIDDSGLTLRTVQGAKHLPAGGSVERVVLPGVVGREQGLSVEAADGRHVFVPLSFFAPTDRAELVRRVREVFPGRRAHG